MSENKGDQMAIVTDCASQTSFMSLQVDRQWAHLSQNKVLEIVGKSEKVQ